MDREEQIKKIKKIYQDLEQNKTESLKEFLREHMKIKNNYEDFFTPFYLAYIDKRWEKAQKPIIALIQNIWHEYNKIKKEESVGITFDQIPEQIEEEYEEKLINSLTLKEILNKLPREEREKWELHLYYDVPLESLFSPFELKRTKKRLKKLLKD